MKVAITLTTIHKPIVIKTFAENIRNFGHQEIEFIIVGDKKTPEGIDEYCRFLHREYSLPIHYLDIRFQIKYLQRFPDLNAHIPYNSFARRNIGDLYAFEKDFFTIIRVDDDNFPGEDDFIKYHDIVCRKEEISILSSSTGWFNICEQLVDKEKTPFYPRGFPYSQRWRKAEIHVEKKVVRPVMNAGLWLGDPDVDAITRLAKPIEALKFEDTFGDQFGLNIGTWCPINTQNTSYRREAIPAAFVSPYVGRYDDIWSGYLLRKVMDHLGGIVTYGRPLLRQDRNQHDLWKDLELEMNGNLYTDHFIQCLDQIELSGEDYLTCYYELAEKLEKAISKNQEVFQKLTTGMKIWSETLQKISN